MTDKELDELLRNNPDVWVVSEFNVGAATLARDHAIVQRTRELLAEPSEEEMQIAVIAWADSQPHPALRWLFHVPNGGHRDPATAGRMKAAGVRKGVPDLLLPWHTTGYAGLAIEMKRRPNKPTLEQIEWLDFLDRQDWRTEVCYSAERAIEVIRAYLGMA